MSATANSTASARIVGRPFGKGRSGNPTGRPKVVFEIRDLARQYGPAAIAKLAELSGLAPGTPAETEATQVAALRELLDRGYGKATQPLSSEDGTSAVALHLIAAETISPLLVAALEQRQPHPTINGRAEPEPTARDLLGAPPPLE